jgi:uncharacterized LabA/DUF88 family protein
MIRKENNYAFIDNQNLFMEVRRCGWELDYSRFIVYLREKYSVKRAFLFLGYMEKNIALYERLHDFGYELIFKKVLITDKFIKGNVDADMTTHVVMRMNNYDKAVIVSGDGDFHGLVEYLIFKDKLECILAPNFNSCSSLLKMFPDFLYTMNRLREQLSAKIENTPKILS